MSHLTPLSPIKERLMKKSVGTIVHIVKKLALALLQSLAASLDQAMAEDNDYAVNVCSDDDARGEWVSCTTPCKFSLCVAGSLAGADNVASTTEVESFFRAINALDMACSVHAIKSQKVEATLLLGATIADRPG
ncbi:MAG: hypothetical protein Q9159_004205 [Coniocarpon cinnabarinum]